MYPGFGYTFSTSPRHARSFTAAHKTPLADCDDAEAMLLSSQTDPRPKPPRRLPPWPSRLFPGLFSVHFAQAAVFRRSAL